MIAACISTLHPVYELLCQKIRRRRSDENGVGPARQRGNATNTPPGAKQGFWSLLLERDTWTESTIISRFSRSLSRSGPAHISEHHETAAIPIRTLEDAQDTQTPDEGVVREARVHKALVKLYHAGLAPYSGRY